MEDIKNFLASSKNQTGNKKKEWPKYITELEKMKRINKKDNGDSEIDIEENSTNNIILNLESKIRNLKSDFRKATKHYFLDNDNKLYYKKIIKTKLQNNKYKTKEEIFLVPTVEMLNDLLYQYHTLTSHANYKILKEMFYKNKIGFLGLDTILQDYIKNCPVCAQVGRTVHRLDPIHPIIVPGPDIRYQFDITYLNSDLQKAFGIKYILSIMDTFSRKAMIYGLNNKSAGLITSYIIDFCTNHNIPKEFSSDNGREFNNKLLDEYCNVNNIKFIHGMPFNPHSQGAIERFNYTIKKYLLKEYIINGAKNLNFNNIKNKVINFYNNKFHRLIGMSPNEAYKITNAEEIDRINNIKIKVFEKVNKKRNFLERNDKCLLNPKCLRIGKNTLIPNKVRKGKFIKKIPIRIIKNTSYGYYLIKLFCNFKNNNINLKKDEEYIVDGVLLKKISSKAWDAIVSKYNKN